MDKYKRLANGFVVAALVIAGFGALLRSWEILGAAGIMALVSITNSILAGK